jgi:chromosome segregation ATPase
MLKKTLYVAAAVALLLGLLFGRDAVSYVSTSVGQLRQHVKDSIPVEVEIQRARDMIKNIDPEIRRSMHLIAKEEVQVEQLAGEIQKLEGQLAKKEGEIMKLKADLDTSEGYFYYASRRYSRDEVKADLANRFENFKINDATLATLQKQLVAREKSLDAARQKLDSMVAQKDQLKVEVANLEARVKMVEVAKTTADFKFDDSQLARTKKLISEIGTRINVEERMLNNYTEHKTEIPVEEPVEVKDVTEEISAYFGGARPSHTVAVDAE